VNVLRQLRALAPTLVLVYGAGVAVLLLFHLAADITGRSFYSFIRDPTSVRRGGDYLTGSLSNLGVLVWWTGAVAAALAGYLRRHDWRGLPLLAAGLFTGWLALDDLFLLHETFFPRRGIGERTVIAAYPLVAAAYALLFRDFLRRSEWILLASAAALFAASIAIDFTTNVPRWEDSAKFLGIVGWTAFLVRAAFFALGDGPVGPRTEDRAGHPSVRAAS
jgi:hypothetical protein